VICGVVVCCEVFCWDVFADLHVDKVVVVTWFVATDIVVVFVPARFSVCFPRVNGLVQRQVKFGGWSEQARTDCIQSDSEDGRNVQ
jgi:hypothetical protein